MIETTSLLYNFMKIHEEITSSMVKEYYNHFRVKKVTKYEAKNPIGGVKCMRLNFHMMGL
jgi:hypothetical protein